MSRGVWIALPTYDERDNLEPMLGRLLEVVPGARVLVVDDGSPDGTGVLADAVAAREPRVSVMHRTTKDGLGAAYRAAFSHLLARQDCDVIVQMDCDFSHDPADVPRLLEAISDGADLAIGSRYVAGGSTPGWTRGRKLISRGGSAFARGVLSLQTRDLTGGFKAWRADLLRSMDLAAVRTQGYGFQIEMTWRAHRRGADLKELPITFSERRTGQSKMSRRIIAEALLMVVRLRLESAGRARSPVSAGPAVHPPFHLGLVGRAGGVGVDDLDALSVVRYDGPDRGRAVAHDARQPKVRF
ncbi:MAG: polyprenol monophosphomannose synthase [Candidatus Limnocylindria bacterium]